MNLKDLSKPFTPEDIEWRMQQSGTKNNKPWGKCLAYVTNRAIMDRLDEVCGPANWKNDFTKAPDGGILCGISINCGIAPTSGAEWVTKWDGAQNTDVEAVKGGLSNAMKRAAVQWGIGRYLYNLDTGWAEFAPKGKYSAKIDGKFHKWNPPQLPAWALPDAKVQAKKSDNDSIPEEQESIPQEEYLSKMKGFAQFEPEAYKKVLDSWRISSAVAITNKESQVGIINEITAEITAG